MRTGLGTSRVLHRNLLQPCLHLVNELRHTIYLREKHLASKIKDEVNVFLRTVEEVAQSI